MCIRDSSRQSVSTTNTNSNTSSQLTPRHGHPAPDAESCSAHCRYRRSSGGQSGGGTPGQRSGCHTRKAPPQDSSVTA
eukprot:6881939-Prorocentrum_lima.AAC.1